mmetsp:Transcript_26639/g.38595  ORF Transcript_26639/g.38595 Transcript_26639/m.38595 type:complete len:111 (+) Transcript_26639:1221-1553(+)
MQDVRCLCLSSVRIRHFESLVFIWSMPSFPNEGTSFDNMFDGLDVEIESSEENHGVKIPMLIFYYPCREFVQKRHESSMIRAPSVLTQPLLEAQNRKVLNIGIIVHRIGC